MNRRRVPATTTQCTTPAAVAHQCHRDPATAARQRPAIAIASRRSRALVTVVRRRPTSITAVRRRHASVTSVLSWRILADTVSCYRFWSRSPRPDRESFQIEVLISIDVYFSDFWRTCAFNDPSVFSYHF